MREIKSEIDLAFRMISTIHVSGDGVDAMAAARVKLRNAIAKCDKKIIEEEAINREGMCAPNKED